MSKEEQRAIFSNPSRRFAPQGERKRRIEQKGKGKNRVDPSARWGEGIGWNFCLSE
jgi:hypothetical protein